MKTLVVHAGMPKNGSSAIQVMLARERDELLARSVDYFQMGEFDEGLKGAISSGNGALLSRTLLPETHEAHLKDPEEIHLNQLINHMQSSEQETGIVSSEFFTNSTSDSLKRLRTICDGLKVRLLFFCYVRRQDQFLMSGYIQRVKRHHCTDYPEDHILNLYKNVGFLNYFSFAESVSAIVGEGNVIVRHFDQCKMHPSGLTIDFLESLAVNVEGLDLENKIVNVSPSPKEIKLLLSLNKFSPSLSLTDKIVHDSANFGRADISTTHAILDPEICSQVLTHFESQNVRLKEKYFSEDHEFDIAVEQNYVDLRNLKLDSEDLMDIFGSIIVRMDRRLNNVTD